MLTESRVASHYQGEAGQAYFAWWSQFSSISARLNRAKFEQFIGTSDDVLDFGCGDGSLLRALGRSGLGVEASLAARATAEAAGVDVVSSLESVASESIDVAISNHALEHTLSPAKELEEIRRVLRPGGRIVLWLPLDDWRQGRDIRTDANHHLYAWTPLTLANLLRETGFEVKDCRVVTKAWPPFATRLHRLPQPIFDALGRATSVALRRRQIRAIATKPL